MQKQLKKDYMEMDNKKMKNSVYWITGLSGAGKTTVGKIFYTKLRNQKDSVLFLDGDRLRDVFGNDLGYTRKDRICCAMRYSKICQMLSEQGMDVVICTISMFHEIRAWNRENIVNYKEIYLEVPMKILKQRKASVDPEKLCSARPSVPLIALQQEFLWESKLWEMKDLEEVFGKHPAVASSWCGKAGPVL